MDDPNSFHKNMVKSIEKDDNGQYPSTRMSDIEVVRKEKVGL